MVPIWIFILHVSAYLGIGLWAAVYAFRYRYVPRQFIVLAAFGVISILYYIVFFITLFSPGIGQWTNYLMHIIGWGLTLYALYQYSRRPKNKTLIYFVFLPLSLMMLMAGYYSIVLSSCRLVVPLGQKQDNSTYCHIQFLPADNALPYLYAKNIVLHKPDVLISDWKLVDRPPIQIGAGLSVLQLSRQDPNDTKSKVAYTSYQLIGTFLQLSWIAAIFGMLYTLGLKLRDIILSIGALGMVGFIYLNTIFVWPKFLAASLVLMGCILLFDTRSKNYKRTLVTAAGAFALGLLIHDGILFSVLGTLAVLGFVMLKDSFIGPKKKRQPLPIKQILIGLLAGAVLLAPWFIYKSNHSSSDRLLKWHLAGIVVPDSRTTTQTIIDSYKTLTPRTWFEGRKANAKMLYMPMQKEEVTSAIKAAGPSVPKLKVALKHLAIFNQVNDFFIVFMAFGIFNLGWFVAFSKRNRKELTVIEKRLLIATAIAVVVWVIIMFLPNSTVIHQGSYATMLIILGLLTTWLARNNLILPIYIIQTFLFVVLWVIGSFAKFDLSTYKAWPAVLATFCVMSIYLGLARVTSKLKLPTRYLH